MTIIELIDYLEENDIFVKEKSFSNIMAISIRLPIDLCFAVAYDKSKFTETSELISALAHEAGHCFSNALHTDQKSSGKCEYSAHKWVINNLIPFIKLKDAVEKKHIGTSWELAEYFDISESYIIRAAQYYKQKNMIIVAEE